MRAIMIRLTRKHCTGYEKQNKHTKGNNSRINAKKNTSIRDRNTNEATANDNNEKKTRWNTIKRNDNSSTTDDDTNNGGRGNLYPTKAQGSRALSRHEGASWKSSRPDIKTIGSSDRDLQFQIGPVAEVMFKFSSSTKQ